MICSRLGPISSLFSFSLVLGACSGSGAVTHEGSGFAEVSSTGGSDGQSETESAGDASGVTGSESGPTDTSGDGDSDGSTGTTSGDGDGDGDGDIPDPDRIEACGEYTLHLHEVDFRGPHFEVLVQQPDGSYQSHTADAQVRTYLGSVPGHPDAYTAAHAGADGVLRAVIYFDRGQSVDCEGGAVVRTAGWEPEVDQIFAWPEAITVAADHHGPDLYEYGVGYDIDHASFSSVYEHDVDAVVEAIERSTAFFGANYIRDAKLKPTIERVIVRASAQSDPYDGITGYDLLGPASDEWQANHSDALEHCFKVVLGSVTLGGGGIAYMGGTYTIAHVTTIFDGSLHGVARHELGHNFLADDYDGASPEGKTIMCGNTLGRFTGPVVEDFLNHRDASYLGTPFERDAGVYLQSEFPPYASLDAYRLVRGSTYTLDLLANDHDANDDTLVLASVDSTSSMGGNVDVSEGTGPGGRDEVLYTPPNTPGWDHFRYEVADHKGHIATGVASIFVLGDPEWAFPAVNAAASFKATSTGSGLVDFQDSGDDGWLEWIIDVPATKSYDIRFEYTCPEARPLDVVVNGVTLSPALAFPPTADWNIFASTASRSVNLNAGPNTIRLRTTGESGGNIATLFVDDPSWN